MNVVRETRQLIPEDELSFYCALVNEEDQKKTVNEMYLFSFKENGVCKNEVEQHYTNHKAKSLL